MIAAIMQPYFFPHIPYFQLAALADTFIFHDDVQYIKAGWINRNRILNNGAPVWITLPVLRAHHERTIDQRAYQLTPGNVARILRRIEASYGNAPRFAEVFPLLQEIMACADPNVAAFNVNLIRCIAGFLGISTKFRRSSEIVKNNRLSGEARVIELCHRVEATRYVNPIGGASLYRREFFETAGIELCFLEPRVHLYHQFGATPVSPLSIIDVLMFNSNAKIETMLKQHRLIR